MMHLGLSYLKMPGYVCIRLKIKRLMVLVAGVVPEKASCLQNAQFVLVSKEFLAQEICL